MPSAIAHPPPPLFRRGPSPLAKLAFFSAVALAMLVVDLRYHALVQVRAAMATVLWPLQKLSQQPISAASSASDWLAAQAVLQKENQSLRDQLAALSLRQLRTDAAEQENQRLRTLLELKQQTYSRAIPAEVDYVIRDAFSRRVMINKGGSDNIVAGQPAVDSSGLIGQVTRVFPLASEVTLLTDSEFGVSVESLRTGVRAIAGGSANSGLIELQFIPVGDAVQKDDLFVTSGLDGVYPQGLPVARVLEIERKTSTGFARVLATPASATEKTRQVLVLEPRVVPQIPVVEPDKKELPAKKKASRNSAAPEKNP